jgi:hypothetical protein
MLAQAFFAQDTIQQKDSVKLSYHQKSMLYSALVPGLGQIRNSIAAPDHNNAIWKVPLIYGSLGAAGYFLATNQITQVQLKQEYTNRLYGGALDPQMGSL